MEKLISIGVAVLGLLVVFYYLFDVGRRFLTWLRSTKNQTPRTWQTIVITLIFIFYGIGFIGYGLWVMSRYSFVLDPFLMTPFVYAIILFTFAINIFLRKKIGYIIGLIILLPMVFRGALLYNNPGSTRLSLTVLNLIIVILMIWDFRSFFSKETGATTIR